MMLERGVEVDHTTLYRWVQQNREALTVVLLRMIRISEGKTA